MSKANDRQVGGEHYKAVFQHWDIVAEHDLDYFQGQITKYVMRWNKKNGLQDLEKARHFLDKYIEIEKAKLKPNPKPLQNLRRMDEQPNPFGYDAAKEL